jgi:hypothetical protein
MGTRKHVVLTLMPFLVSCVMVVTPSSANQHRPRSLPRAQPPKRNARVSLSDQIERLRVAAPKLVAEVDGLAEAWLGSVLGRLDAIRDGIEEIPKSKQINDPVWEVITVEPAEILLLDSPLLQRMRGVRQLGLAHLVFPGATHDRFAHICGVLEAAARMYSALANNQRV